MSLLYGDVNSEQKKGLVMLLVCTVALSTMNVQLNEVIIPSTEGT